MIPKIPICLECGYMLAAWTERDTYAKADTLTWRCVNRDCKVLMENTEPTWVEVRAFNMWGAF